MARTRTGRDFPGIHGDWDRDAEVASTLHTGPGQQENRIMGFHRVAILRMTPRATRSHHPPASTDWQEILDG